MSCKKCNDCEDNGCAPLVYPDCILTKIAYPCIGVSAGKTGTVLFAGIESSICGLTSSIIAINASITALQACCLANTGTAWVSPDLSGNASITNNLNTRYRRVDSTHVELNIYLNVDIPNILFSRALYTLPAGFRPTVAPQYFHINVFDVGAPTAGYKAVVEIQVTGVVSITVLDTIVGGTDVTVLGVTGIFPID